jgi:hypothetical protein
VFAASQSHSTPIAPISLPSSITLAVVPAGRQQQQGEFGTMSDLMASKIVGNRVVVMITGPGRRRDLPYKSLS